MNIRKVLALRGPNIWAYFPVLEAWVDLGEWKDSASSELPGFNDRLMAWLPSLVEHRCSVGERGGFFERLRRGTYLAHILEHVAIELQCLAGTEVGFGKARLTAEDGVYKVVVEYQEEELARACLETARELCLAAVQDRPFDVAAEVQRLRELAGRLLPDPCTAAILAVARRRKIPARRLDDGFVQLGHGVRQHLVRRTITDRTEATALLLADDRALQRQLLQRAGVPVPAGELVSDAAAAWAAAEYHGLPAIATPRRGHPFVHTERLTTPEQVRQGYERAASHGPEVLIEKAVAGQGWRLLLAGDRLVSAWPASAAPGHGAADMTGSVHAEVIETAATAARALGLHVAWVDVVAEDIGRPLEAQGGAVVGVQADVGASPHLPATVPVDRLGEAIVADLFPPPQNGRIPIVAITGVNGKTTTTRLIAHIAARVHRCVGMTCTEGIYIGGKRIEVGDCSGPQSAATVLQNRKVDVAVLETARGGILRAGLGFDRCNVAVVTNIADGDHLGVAGIETPEQLALVKRTVVDVVLPEGAAVLKADDPLVAQMAEHSGGGVIFFARDGRHPVIVAHRARQGRAAFVRDGRIILAEGPQEIPLAPLECVPLTHRGQVGFQIENALAAAAAAWALGIPCETIRAGLETFGTRMDTTPGRFNLLAIHGATVLMDYGHNVHAISCLLESLEQLPHPRRIAVFSVAGDRRDEDFVRQGELLGEHFDRVLIYEDDDCFRGRKPGEIAALLRKGLSRGRRVREIEVIDGAVRAAQIALESARPADLVFIQLDRVDETIELVRHCYLSQGGREIDFQQAIALGRPAPANRPAEAIEAISAA
jgi:cyanophycin synthetase